MRRPGSLRRVLSAQRAELAFLGLLLILLPLRGYWTPDEPDFAQCIKEMRQRGTWLFPWLNGEIYTEKPILFYWLMKAAALAGEALTGGLGFARGIAPWALRLPSLVAATAMAFGLRAWARRFLEADTAASATLVLLTSPLWIWQAQFIQVDMLFATLLAGSWMAWIGGYALLCGEVPEGVPGEARHCLRLAYALLGLAVLAKGPLALALSAALGAAFLTLQSDWRSLPRLELPAGLLLLCLIVLPWYLAASLAGGADYAYAMIVRQNLDRAFRAWDHIQPWWRYFSYLAADFFPWSLLLPAAVGQLLRRWRNLATVPRFTLLAWAVPFLLLSFSASKQGKYLLMGYPFLALTVALGLQEPAPRLRAALRTLMAAALALPGLLLLLVSLAGLGGLALQARIDPLRGPLGLLGLLLLLGSGGLLRLPRSPNPAHLLRRTGVLLGVTFLLVLPWAFRRVNPLKDYRTWNDRTRDLIEGRQVYFWSEIRSGAMIHTDRLMPVLADASALARLGPGDRLVATRRRWKAGSCGLTPELMAAFEVVYQQPQGGDGLILLARRP